MGFEVCPFYLHDAQRLGHDQMDKSMLSTELSLVFFERYRGEDAQESCT